MDTIQTTKNEITTTMDIFGDMLKKVKLYIPDIIMAIIVFVIGYIIAKEVKNLLKKAMNKHNADITVAGFFAQVVYFITIIAFAIISLTIVGVPANSFITMIGALGLAIGLALQSNLSNFASGIIILIFKPFKVGDYIEIKDGVSGTVCYITTMNTSLETTDSKKVYIPNSVLTNNYVINYSQNTNRNMILNIRITYDTNEDVAIKIIKKILQDNEYIIDKGSLVCEISDLSLQGVNIMVKSAVKNKDYFTAQYQILRQIKKEFGKNDIKFANINTNINM